MNRLQGGDDLLQRGVQPALRELLLQLGGGQRIWGTERRYGRDECRRAVGAAVGPRLSHRLDEGDVHTLAIKGPYQSEARPGQADTGTGRHHEQASDHELSSDAGESTATAGNYAGGVAGDQEFLVGWDDEGQDRRRRG